MFNYIERPNPSYTYNKIYSTNTNNRMVLTHPHLWNLCPASHLQHCPCLLYEQMEMVDLNIIETMQHSQHIPCYKGRDFLSINLSLWWWNFTIVLLYSIRQPLSSRVRTFLRLSILSKARIATSIQGHDHAFIVVERVMFWIPSQTPLDTKLWSFIGS